MVWELQGCVGVIGCCPLMASAPCVTLMLHCGDHRLHTWHNQGFQFQLALCGTYQLHFAVWFLFETCFVLGKLGVVHFNHAHLAKHQCHITVLVNNICNYFLFRLQSSLDSGYLYSSVYVPVHQESLMNAQTHCQST